MLRLALDASSVRRPLLALMALLLTGCQSLYFQSTEPPPGAPMRYGLHELPFSEYWTGLVFNGEKIGFTRFSLRALPGSDSLYEIRSEASFVLRFLGIEKKIHLKARDTIRDDLALLDFDYDYVVDGSELAITGHRDGSVLQVSVTNRGNVSHTRFEIEGPLHPSSVIALYPVVHGLAAGQEYRYRVYDGQLQTVSEVTQHVEGYESSSLFSGNAFKILTAMHGQNTTTWIDSTGRPVFELAMRGVMISALEQESDARKYVALSALNRQEALIDFSLIKPDIEIPAPRDVAQMKVVISGLDRIPPATPLQRCRSLGQDIECEIRVSHIPYAAPSVPAISEAAASYLGSSPTVQSSHSSIRATAKEIAGDATEPADFIQRLVSWMQRNIEKVPLDVFSALDVLQLRRAECQGHAYLYTALARALGIPTRMVSGLVYSEDLKGFLFHSWAESLIGNKWLAVDPTFGQVNADATHIRLLEGESLADLLPLAQWVGRLSIRVLALERGAARAAREGITGYMVRPPLTSITAPLI